MENLSDQTLAGIVTGDHRAAGIFERYHLDYCCKGKTKLGDACREKGIDVSAIAGELENLTTDENKIMPFAEMNAVQLTNFIVTTHHYYVKQSMPRIQSHLHKIVVKHGEKFPYMQKVYQLFTELSDDMTQHMEKEEEILFPGMNAPGLSTNGKGQTYIADAFIGGAVQVMESEHTRAGELVQAIRILTHNYAVPEGACTTFKVCLAELKEFEEDLHRHVHLENYILFPKALQLL